MKQEWISHEHIIMIITAIIVGTLARIFSLKEDFRQYPSYPNGYLIHIVTGFISAALGAVAIPALLTKNFVAVTFLAIAIQQFRDVRKAEKESLTDLENTEYVFRGNAYIDGIAKSFESRNYFSLVVSFVTALTIQIVNSKSDWINILVGCIVGLVIFYILKRFSKGKTIGDIAEVEQGQIEVRDSELYVNDLFVSNLIGSDYASQLFNNEGLAVIITPHEYQFSLTLNNLGQRQAALFEAARAVGVKRYHFTRKDFETGKVILAIVPLMNDIDRIIEAVKKTPLLESVKKSEAVMDTNLFGKK
ncbi:YIEGIA family protein [Heyndrickxia oleronia]|uniref:YIEGIA family protein n=1 Tax=Heyndrickxia oleronia TaxID=38875 RepID=A0AAW6SQW3_9BACI|nr:YIEGIA family protein [Heyndrickxia oleronia]MDH5159653.1 YIEGIA family protein [Heyndrickxia oleronia]